jgi:hypothetical protein
MVLETDDVRDAELLHQQPDQVDAITFGLTIVVQVGIGPDALRILEDQRSLRRIDLHAVRLGENVGS